MISARHYRLIELLADGRFHSGEELGRALGVSRAAVWKMLSAIEPLALEVHALRGKGYRLAMPFEPLHDDAILAVVPAQSRPLLASLEVLKAVESTNSYLLQQVAAGHPSGSVCVAEFQHGGRGRRGRQWHSPYGSNLYLSLLWRFQDGTSRLGGLSLAVAVALMRTLSESGMQQVGIKWPNDILVQGKKLAGILLDVAGEGNGPCHVVIGIGINVRMSEHQAAAIDQPWSDLWRSTGDARRNHLAGRLLHHLLWALQRFQLEGLEPFRSEWRQWDLCLNRSVTLHYGAQVLEGVARGIDEAGLLRVEHHDGIRHYASGEVSLRSRS